MASSAKLSEDHFSPSDETNENNNNDPTIFRDGKTDPTTFSDDVDKRPDLASETESGWASESDREYSEYEGPEGLFDKSSWVDAML